MDSNQTPKRDTIAGTPFRVRVPKGEGPYPALVMIHGYQGTEDVTWVFSRNVPMDWLIASPRGPYPLAEDYGWFQFDEGRTDPKTLQVGRVTLERFIEGLRAAYPIDCLVLLGFSQGAVMAYAHALRNPVQGVISLGGWLPNVLADDLTPLKEVPILILHGTEDETIPVGMARKTRDKLLQAGAQVTYLEEAVGHRVGPEGNRTLEKWLANRTK